MEAINVFITIMPSSLQGMRGSPARPVEEEDMKSKKTSNGRDLRKNLLPALACSGLGVGLGNCHMTHNVI
jgi:hypothetical protein